MRDIGLRSFGESIFGVSHVDKRYQEKKYLEQQTFYTFLMVSFIRIIPNNMKKQPKLGSKEHIEAKFKQQIDLLNDIIRYKIGPSDIEGVGIIAIKDIKKGTILEMDALPHQFDLPFKKFPKLEREVQDILLGYYPLIESGSHFSYPITRFQAFLNHSDEPNYDAVKDVAIKNIKKGEEITEDYRLIKGHKKIFPWLVTK